ncbi:hypothetical protein OHU10_37125 [Streptomyces europaeiscabiei]
MRSSSPQEDREGSSLAGRFDSVLDVRGWEEFRGAVRTVLDSARQPDGDSAPMAVLVQPMIRARVGGVLFGADPVAGRTDRMLVSAVRGGPDTSTRAPACGVRTMAPCWDAATPEGVRWRPLASKGSPPWRPKGASSLARERTTQPRKCATPAKKPARRLPRGLRRARM